MSATEYASVLGLGFGDCGKGQFTDALARRWRAHSVVRFNGGAQAGHNVVVPGEAGGPARHHTFSQFGAATFVPAVRTVLLDPMVVHPTALLEEAAVLGRAGVHDGLARLVIDGRCRVTTPLHQAAGRLRERLRGIGAHGTCGVGVGETVRHSLMQPAEALRYGDLPRTGAARAASQVEKLRAIRSTFLAELLPLCEATEGASSWEELRLLQDDSWMEDWLNQSRALARQCPPASPERIHETLTLPGCVLFEGAQGILLDEWQGFHPHTTWSSITTAAVEKAAAGVGITSAIRHHGVLRSYLTRHGHGPLPTRDEALDRLLPEPHNLGQGWQGLFRRGHPDAVLLRYALEAVGVLSGLLVSHLDVFQRGVTLKWCEGYDIPSSDLGLVTKLTRLPRGEPQDLNHQSRLTRLLLEARPSYAAEPVVSADAFLDRIADVTPLPVVMTSHGAGFPAVR